MTVRCIKSSEEGNSCLFTGLTAQSRSLYWSVNRRGINGVLGAALAPYIVSIDAWTV